MIKKTILVLMLTTSLSSCAGKNWNTTNLKDEFTGSTSCRVEAGTQAQRDFIKGFTGNYFTYHFFAENRDGEVRAGLTSEPVIPIIGNVQIKIGQKLVTLTLEDTPLDVTPQMPQYKFNKDAEKTLGAGFNASVEQMTKNIQKMSSPYRALTGKKAENLLKDMAAESGEIKYRVVGINSTLSATGTITTGPEFTKALNKCGILEAK